MLLLLSSFCYLWMEVSTLLEGGQLRHIYKDYNEIIKLFIITVTHYKVSVDML